MENLMNYFPCGMLDRNQRTILTISLLKENFNTKLLLIENNLIKTDYKNHQIINNNNIIVNNNNCNNLNNLINNNNNNKFNIINKLNYNEKSTKLFMKTRNKLKSLLPCIVLLLILFLQPAYAKPIHRRIMENSSDNGVDNVDFNQITNDKKCQILNNVLTILGFERYQKLLNQKILNEVNNYTNKTYRVNHLQHHQEWKPHHNEILDPKGGRLNFNDYHKEPPAEVVSHLYREDITIEEKSINELINIYERFKLILNGIQKIIKAKEDDGNDNIEHDPDVMGYFKNQEMKIMELLKEIEMGLETLHVHIPEINFNNIIYEYKNDGFDWITIREYLKLLVYTQKAFNILLEHCPQKI